jgi:DNA-binding XRE family transcriptional regulator
MPIVDKAEIAQQVLDRRLELGYYRQSEAAQQAGVSPTTWGLLESQGQVPKTTRLRHQVARALQWPPDVFEQMLTGQAPKPVRTQGDELAEVLDQGLARLAEAIQAGRDEDRSWYREQLEALRRELSPQTTQQPEGKAARR